MNAGAPIEGVIQGLALPRAFGGLCLSRATGALVLEQGSESSRVFLGDGRPTGAVALDDAQALGTFLVEKGVLSGEDQMRSLAEMARTKRTQAQVLVDLGLLTSDALSGLLVDYQVRNLVGLLAWREGAYRFEARSQLPSWLQELEVDPFLVLLSLFQRPEEVQRVGELLVDLGDASLRFVPNKGLLANLDLDKDTRAFLRLFDAPVAAVDVIASSGLEMERAGAILAASWCLGLVGPTGPSGEAASGAPDTEAALDGPTEEGSSRSQETGAGGEGRNDEASGSQKAPRRSDDSSMRARRSRLLRRAFKNIPGADVLKSREGEGREPRTPTGGSEGRSTPRASAGSRVEKSASSASSSAENKAGKQGGPGGFAPGADGAKGLDQEVRELGEAIGGQDFYERLGVAKTAADSDIRTAYLSKVKRFHPDRTRALGLSSESAECMKKVFSAIQQAYEVLGDPQRRREYDGVEAKDEPLSERDKERALAKAFIDFKKGEGLFKKRDFARALEYFDEALAVDSKNGLWLTMHAWARYNIGPRDKLKNEVRSVLSRATRLEGGKAMANYYLGILSRVDGKFELAEKHFEAAVESGCKLPEVSSELREVRRKLGKDKRSPGKGLFKRLSGKR